MSSMASTRTTDGRQLIRKHAQDGLQAFAGSTVTEQCPVQVQALPPPLSAVMFAPGQTPSWQIHQAAS
jgi:hypothetical protein